MTPTLACLRWRRCGLMIDNEGNIIWSDRMMMLLLEDILPRRPGADVLFDVKSPATSRH